MRAILPYLKTLPTGSVSSLFFNPGSFSENSSNGSSSPHQINYHRIPYLNARGFRNLSIFLGTFLKLIPLIGQSPRFLVIPNSLPDLLMGLACRIFSPRVTVWIMDDFSATFSNQSTFQKILYPFLFRILYCSARQRIVVSHAMSLRYQQTLGVAADQILGRSLPEVLPPLSISNREKETGRKKLRFVYIGSFLDFYFEPIQVLKTLDFEFEIDLYGIHAPPECWLLEGKITYCGPLEDHLLLKTLQNYDFGLVCYSFTAATEALMEVSFPSKLIDYLGAALPCWVIAPQKLSFLQAVGSRQIGIVQTELSREATLECLKKLASAPTDLQDQWRLHSHQWAVEEFLFNPKTVSLIFHPELS